MKRRVFVSINPPHEIKNQVSAFIKKYASKYKEIDWINPDSFHITLFFLGNVEEPQIAKITAISKLLLKNHKIFTARFTNSEVYPSFKEAKLVWLRSASNFDLVSLQGKIVSQLKLNGFKFENSVYLPHATLGNVKKPIKNVESLMKDLSSLILDGFLISHIDIMESVQTKNESIHKILFRVPLENSVVSKNIFV